MGVRVLVLFLLYGSQARTIEDLEPSGSREMGPAKVFLAALPVEVDQVQFNCTSTVPPDLSF